MSDVPFASAADDREQRARLVMLAPDVYGFVSDFDPNCGFVVGDEFVVAIDTRATPRLARELLAAIASVTDKPVRYVFLTHYHAVRVLGASAFGPQATVIASRGTLDWIDTRGEADYASELGRFPRLFQGHDEIPGLTRPHLTFDEGLSLWTGRHELRFLHLGRGHSQGDSVCWIPSAGVLFSGDLVENHCAVYAGDGYVADWMVTLDRLKALQPRVLLPGRGAALTSGAEALGAIDATRGFLQAVGESVRQGLARGATRRQIYEATLEAMTPHYGTWPVFQHVLPFDVCRAIEEQTGVEHPSLWTHERDQQLWQELHG